LELALFFHREKLLGFRTAANPDGLTLPFIIDDGDSFPPEVQSIQGEKITILHTLSYVRIVRARKRLLSTCAGGAPV
jgi:hypothetical protein